MVVAIIGLLISLLVPVLASARQVAFGSSCLSNQHQLLIATQTYANDHDDKIPYGPVEPNGGQPNGADDFYIFNGMATSQISTKTGEPAGAGLLLADYLSDQAEVLFCPGNEQDVNVSKEIANVGTGSAVSAYIYRHASTTFSDVLQHRIRGAPLNDNLKISALGKNSQGQDVNALFIDYNFLLAPGSDFYNVYHRSNHGSSFVNVAYADGHAEQHSNTDGRYSVNVIGTSLYKALDKMLLVMEEADQPD